jgi:integrase
MNEETDQSNDRTAEKQPAASSRLPAQRPRRRHQGYQRGLNGGPLRDRKTGRPREGLALARHRNGVHRNLKQVIICEIPNPLPVSSRELDVFAATRLKKLPSAEAAGIARDILKREMGDKRLAALVLQNFDDFRDRLKAQGKSIGYVSRILSVLRSSANRAVENKKTTVKLKVPEFQPRSKKKNLKKKGPLLTCQEIAAIIDEINDQHLLLLVILLIHLGARVGAILDAIKAQIDLEQNRFDLNPPGRETTNKGRPVLPIPMTLGPWLEDLPDGPLITYRGAAIAEADTAFNSAVHRSKIGKKANTYSIRHSLSRYMRKMRVDLEEIGIYLGHGNHDPETETTLIYCPWEPEYLVNCREAAEAFVREINTHTRKWDLLRPYCVKPNYVEN